MTAYYIDAAEGSNSNSGLSPDNALKNDCGLAVKPGDIVLFRRGSFIRGRMNNVSGEEGSPITYSAYGEGDAPVFCGSADAADEKLWTECGKNIWSCTPPVNDEVTNIVFDGGKSYGAFCWKLDDLKNQGDFYDECLGFKIKKKPIPENHKIYVYSEKNPAHFYKSIELCLFAERITANNGHDMIIENIKFLNCGVHVIAGEAQSRNLIIRNCIFENIGGGVWDDKNKIRYGNCVEFWDVGENIEVTNCLFNNVYDSAVTHQGMEKCKCAEKLNFHHNVFIKCGMAAYEQRDRMPVNSCFNDNICVDAGEGFSKLGEEMPRYSEIWPQPMGHHIFLWRIENADSSCGLEIKNNIFYNSPYGAAVYSIIDEKAENSVDFDNNLYYNENGELLVRWHGENYKAFDECSYIDKNGRSEKIDIDAVVKKRIEEITESQKNKG